MVHFLLLLFNLILLGILFPSAIVHAPSRENSCRKFTYQQTTWINNFNGYPFPKISME